MANPVRNRNSLKFLVLSRGLALLILCIFAAGSTAFAQFTAGVQGSVRDAAGANIPNVQMILLNIATKVQQSGTSDASGVYRFPNLGPGDYEISASANGFQRTQAQFTLTSGEVRDVSLTLSVGSSTTNLVVTAQAPLLDTADSRESLTLNQSSLQNLPLATRNPMSLVGLAPGVTGIQAATTTFNPETTNHYSSGGKGGNANTFIVDGLDVDSDIGEGVTNLTPNVDALSEVTVQTNVYNVDYGKSSSIETVMSSRPGTTEYHGFASGYYADQDLSARGEYGVPAGQRVSPFHTTALSFGVGGPIIPNRRFFFFATLQPYFSSTPNAALTAVGALAPNSGSLTYEDPAFAAFAQQVMPNTLETSLFSKYPVKSVVFQSSKTAQQVFGAQNTAANTGCGTPSTDNIPCSMPVYDQGIFNASAPNTSYQYSGRVDKVFDRDRIYGIFFRNTIVNQAPSPRPQFTTSSNLYTFSLQGNETHTFSTQLLNEAFFGYNRIEGYTPNKGLFYVPVTNVTGLGVGWGDANPYEDYIQHGYHWRDVATYIRGNHEYKIGYEGWHGDDLAYFAGRYSQPIFTYTNIINLINDNPYTETNIAFNPVTGQPVADNYGFAKGSGGAFAEDNWKLTRRLTINYGIRYDNFGNAYPALGQTVLANFHPAAASTFAESIANGVFTQQSHTFAHDLNWIFSPRAGFAYDLFGKGEWVVRGGFGVYRDEFTLGNQENGLIANPPGPVRPTFKNDGSTPAPIYSFGTSNTYPFGFTYPNFTGEPLDAKGGRVGGGFTTIGIDPNLSMPHVLNYTLTLEHSLTRSLVASIGYQGSHSGNLITNGGNLAAHTYGNDVNAYAGDLLQHPSFAASGKYSGTGVQDRLNTSFAAISYATNGPTGNYNALIAAIKGRFARRGFITASYTHSKAMDDWGSYPTAAPPYNQYYSPSQYNVPNAFSLGWAYDLPGETLSNRVLRRVAGGWTLSGVTSLQSGTPFTVQNTNPLAVSATGTDGVAITSANYASELAGGHLQYVPTSGDYNADGNNTDYPNVTSYAQKHSRSDYVVGHGIFPVCAGGALPCGNFTLPQFGNEGNQTPNRFLNPGYADTDLTLKKTTAITERVNVEFRLDTFNLFNRVNLMPVDVKLQDTTFGQSTSTYAARNMLLGAKVNF
ncbi:carboxypeptidase regulatory-like domain-containing protein [Silvibacterium acidisoli]|uniref:carboxypeptidase regulatory-like domain-containing protein n=1 Tax=Acidobacteriaceae bacterium ZG23-2 TaxID=2883246 RepID=UPI00406CA634